LLLYQSIHEISHVPYTKYRIKFVSSSEYYPLVLTMLLITFHERDHTFDDDHVSRNHHLTTFLSFLQVQANQVVSLRSIYIYPFGQYIHLSLRSIYTKTTVYIFLWSMEVRVVGVAILKKGFSGLRILAKAINQIP